MTERGVDLIGRLFEAIALEDLPTILELLDPAVEVRDHDLPDADPYHGHDGFLRWAANWEESFDETTFEVEELTESGGRVLSIVRMVARGRGSGLELERRDGIVWRLHDGSVTRLDYYGSADLARDAAAAPSSSG
jgi:ketosteroid isomerase-like protein